jgi:DNA-binding NtrC family response regulator
MRPGVALVLSRLHTSEMSGLDLLRRLRPARPALPIIIIDSRPTTDIAIEAARLGAYDYIPEPFELAELLEVITKAIRTRDGFLKLTDFQTPASLTGLVGSSRAMHELFKQIGRAATAPANLLIRGASGTGKELVARAVHSYSLRREHPFVAVNCTAIPETLFESELFGHEGGAFTGAARRRAGLFEQAQHGTLLLDEIGDLTRNSQVKLLRVLEERTIRRLGGRKPIDLDIQIVAATHRDLEYLVEIGAFREDLLQRLSESIITLPELREHREDIWPLVQHFLIKYQAQSPPQHTLFHRDALTFLEAQAWPGNVRQLANTVRRALVAAQGQPITLAHVQQACSKQKPAGSSQPHGFYEPPTDLFTRAEAGQLPNLHSKVIDEVERSMFRKAILKSGGNQSKIARLLGLTRKTVRQKLIQLGFRSPADDYRASAGPQA